MMTMMMLTNRQDEWLWCRCSWRWIEYVVERWNEYRSSSMVCLETCPCLLWRTCHVRRSWQQLWWQRYTSGWLDFAFFLILIVVFVCMLQYHPSQASARPWKWYQTDAIDCHHVGVQVEVRLHDHARSHVLVHVDVAVDVDVTVVADAIVLDKLLLLLNRLLLPWYDDRNVITVLLTPLNLLRCLPLSTIPTHD